MTVRKEGEMGGVYVMWFDNEQGKPLGAKVIQAVAYYVKRFGVMPEVAFVNEWEYTPSQPPPFSGENGGGARLEGMPVEVRPVRYVLPNHVLVGREVEDDVDG